VPNHSIFNNLEFLRIRLPLLRGQALQTDAYGLPEQVDLFTQKEEQEGE